MTDLIVETKKIKLFDKGEKFSLQCGKGIAPVEVAYETYGKLNADKSNAILICHALSGDAHVAGKHSSVDKKAGWWDILVGPGKAFDTDKYFVICSNVLGGCSGTTGPGSVNPETGKPYALGFPFITIGDMVRLQKKLLEALNIGKLLCVTGGSVGGMQALEWAISFPDVVRSCIPIATGGKLSTQAIAFNEVGRHAIISDPAWNGGNYYDEKKKPDVGLSIARMIGHITYLSEELLHKKFGRELQERMKPGYGFEREFQVESYLHYKGTTFTERFDANSYLYITRAMDYFNVEEKCGGLECAFENVKAKFLVLSFSSDWLFPTKQSKEIVKALLHNKKCASFCEIPSDYGHDAFLLDADYQAKLISSFLGNV